MSLAPPRAFLIVCLLFVAAEGTPAHAQKEHSPGLLRGLIGEIVPGSAREIEERALRARDGSEALRLYGSLQSRYAGDPEGVRAALWVGLYYYGVGEEESSLEYFERARKNARTGDLRARAVFWCDQVRLRTGREPLPIEEEEGGMFGALGKLTRVDRSVREGRRGEAENGLLALEGEARRAGLLGPCLARWGDVLRMPGSGRVDRGLLEPLDAACSGLPERLRMAARTDLPRSSEPEVWSLQFGAFLDRENATRQADDLRRQGLDPRIDESEEEGRSWFRTRFGEVSTRAMAESLAAAARLPQGIPYQIVRVR
jgi:hypothetical protein